MSLRSLLACLLVAGCSPSGETAEPAKLERGLVTSALERALPSRRPPPPKPPQLPARGPALDRAACETELARVRKLPGLPGTPKLDRERAEAVARAKGEPVIFVRAPEPLPSQNKIVRAYRRALSQSRFPWDTLERIQDQFQTAPRMGRQVILRDGYFYADTADLAYSLWEKIRL